MTNFIKKYWAEILQIEVALAGAILLLTFAAPCETGMVCRHTASIAFFLFLGMGLIGIIKILIIRFIPKLKLVPVTMQTVLFFLQFSNIANNGGCKITGMRCLTYTFPYIYLFTSLIIVILVIDVTVTYVFAKEEKLDENADSEESDTP